jgi:preprotein translocase subunit SecG
MEKQTKKGQLGMELITGFTIVAAVLMLIVLLVFTFGSIGQSLEFTKSSNSVVNASAPINATGYQLASGVGGTPRDYALVMVLNGSTAIPSNNYTLSSTGVLTNTSVVVWQSAKVSYTFNNDSSEISGTQAATNNVTKSIPLVGILFIILAVASIIGILIVSMVGRNRA